MKKIVTVAIAFLFAGSIKSQTAGLDVWKPIKEKDVALSGARQIIPQKYLTVNADINSLKDKLFAAPAEKNTNINLSSCIIVLPLPDGTFGRFRVVNSPVMAEELASAFPDIKTFSIKGIDDPYANGKLDWNEFGFHGMVRTPAGDYFIDPYCLNNTSDYIAYYTNDFVKDPSQAIPEAGLLGIDEGQKKPAANDPIKTGLNYKSAAGAICTGANLRTYRLAIACTGEYAKAATGLAAPTVAQTLAKIVTTVNRVDGVYETEVAVRMVLVATETMVIFTNPSTDPFSGNNNANTLINESQTVISGTIGIQNFDIGHTFSTGGGGLAYLGCVCVTSNKARGITGSGSPVGDPYDIDYVAHEMGHQFGGSHTFNAGTGSCNGNRNGTTAVEPGSGITIMAYAGICGSIDNLGAHSIAYFHGISYDEIVNYTNNNSGNTCATTSTTSNLPPVVTAPSNIIIPVSTPFFLTGSATDPNGDALTYSWEETDPGISASSWNTGNKPYFMSYVPSTNPTRLFPNATVVNSGNYTGTRGEYLPTTPQTLNFRLTARDNKMGGGGVCYTNISVLVDAAGPLTVTYPSSVGIAWLSGSTQNVTWDVNGTSFAPISCDSVKILISYNSGNTYTTLVYSTANDGIESVTVPSVTGTIVTCRIKVEARGNTFYDIGNYNFTISNDPTTGFKEISQNNSLGLSVWPNPAKETLNFAIGNLNNNAETNLEISDVLGNTVYKSRYTNKSNLTGSIELTGIASGVYFIKVNNNNNQAVYRLIKE